MDYMKLEIFIIVLIVILYMVLIVGTAPYLLSAIGIHYICKELGCTRYAYLGWIPIANIWIVAFLAAECNPNVIKEHSSKSIAWVYLGCTVGLGWILGWLGIEIVTWPLLFFVGLYLRVQIIGRYYGNMMKWLLAFLAPVGLFLAGIKACERIRYE